MLLKSDLDVEENSRSVDYITHLLIKWDILTKLVWVEQFESYFELNLIIPRLKLSLILSSD